MIELVDGRWLVLNATTHRSSEAGRLMYETRQDGSIDLDDWTDITVLRTTMRLDWSRALTIASNRRPGQGLRPACPDRPELSQLYPGDSVHVMRSTQPEDSTRPMWVVMLHLTDDDVWLRYVVPFGKSSEAEELLLLTARTNAFVTEDFTDVTEEMESVDIDRSDEVEIDEDGNKRTLQ
jgi:hypothetical protein